MELSAVALTRGRHIRLRSSLVKGWRKFATAAMKWTFSLFRLKARTLDNPLSSPGMASNGLMLRCICDTHRTGGPVVLTCKSLGSGRAFRNAHGVLYMAKRTCHLL